MAHFHMGEARYSLGEYEQAAELLDRALTLRAADPRPILHAAGRVEVVARRWRAQALAELGRFDKATTLAREAIEIARELNDPYSLANALAVWSIICARQGNFQAAIPALEEGLQLSRTLGFLGFVPTFANQLAEVRAQLGRPAEAAALLDETPSRILPTYVRVLTLVLIGQLAEARRLIDEVLPRHRERAERGAEAWILWLLGEIAAKGLLEDVGSAADQVRQALALADELGMRPLIAHCHLGLGKLSRGAGKRQEAQEHLTTATTMYREMDMRFWLEQAEAWVIEQGGADGFGSVRR
jgi:tetratricopeptide (TPR) repeat protein